MGIDLEEIRERFACKGQDVRSYAPLTLAYLGDAVYELLVRSVLVSEADVQVHRLHLRATSYVSAAAQAQLIRAILPELTQEELGYYRRGRNAKPHSVPKNAVVADYRAATGLEALCGYWYLTGQTGRLLALIKMGIEEIDPQRKGKNGT